MADLVREENPLSTEGQALLARLSELAAEPGRRIFAVMDGARFENLAASLYRADIAHRPLYRHAGGDYAIVAGGPWFVDPSLPAQPLPLDDFGLSGEADALSDEALAVQANFLSQKMLENLSAGDVSAGGMLAGAGTPQIENVAARLEALLRIADGRSAIVFWVGDETLTSETLFRHLRGLNRIAIPRGAASDVFDGERVELAAAGGADASAEPQAERAPATETVIFRHADPNVMMQVFPVLDEAQALRLFGPAEQMFFSPDALWGGGVKRGRRPGAGAVPSGFFHLSAENLGQIHTKRLEATRDMRIAYLKKCCGDELAQVEPQALAEHVLVSEQTGRKLGLVSEAAHCRWAYLMFATRGRIAASPEVAVYIRHGGADPDRQVDLVLKSTIASLKAERARMGASG